ncbi:hypothetical protein GCM10009550_17770 [Actinocorallia libanotica]|uniref:Uncharacterized protein n=1 Tax=Actinocorallia libanotica TaxID=46162 RepID=A0ABN1QMN5_9ACTN
MPRRSGRGLGAYRHDTGPDAARTGSPGQGAARTVPFGLEVSRAGPGFPNRLPELSKTYLKTGDCPRGVDDGAFPAVYCVANYSYLRGLI